MKKAPRDVDRTDERESESEASERAARKKLIGAMALRDPIGYYGSRQSDNPARRIAEQRFRMPYGYYNRARRDLHWDSPGWPVSGGEFTGRGPKGYRRSDSRIEDDIVERLTMHGQIDASDITISVKDGQVTLEGTVRNRETKRHAEDVALSVPGVIDVHNRLRISQ